MTALLADFDLAFGKQELIDMGDTVVRKQDAHLKIPRKGVVVSIGQMTARVQWDRGGATIIKVSNLVKIDVDSKGKR